MATDREAIKIRISEIEEEIRKKSEHTNFTDPAFSEWYNYKVSEIERLQEMIKDNV